MATCTVALKKYARPDNRFEGEGTTHTSNQPMMGDSTSPSPNAQKYSTRVEMEWKQGGNRMEVEWK